MIQKTVFAIACSLLLQACSSPGAWDSPGAQALSHLSFELVGYDHNFKKPDERPLVNNTVLWLPGLSGAFFGTPDTDSRWSVRANSDDQYELSIEQLQTELSASAAPFDVTETALMLEPQTTRLATINSYVLSTFDGEPLGISRWQNQRSKREMMLVYFDRPCRVLGSVFNGDTEIRFNVSVPEAGLYWLESKFKLFGPNEFALAPAKVDAALAVARK